MYNKNNLNKQDRTLLEMCRSKDYYETESEIRSYIKRHWKQYKIKRWYYHCPQCNGFHQTRQEKPEQNNLFT